MNGAASSRRGFSASDEAFRQQVRDFLATQLNDELRCAGKMTTGVFTDAAGTREWHRILYRKGWVAATWPKEYGGPGWSIAQQYIFFNEVAEAAAPKLPAMGLRMVAPAIMRYGRDQQKAYYLPRILSGADYWCQGYSEPGSGSDLASLQTKAVSDGEYYVVNGAKIWTTHAQFANRIFCLVRTSNAGRPQQGITFLLIDMNTPGIKVEPIITLAGDHEVNQVYFDDVRVPKENRLGEEGEGWMVAKYLLEFERSVAYAGQLRADLRTVVAMAKQASADGRSLYEEAALLKRLMDAEIALKAYEGIEFQILGEVSRGESTGAKPSLLKVMSSELQQQITELGKDVAGYYAAAQQCGLYLPDTNGSPIGQPYAMTAMARYLNTRATTIFGGTSEIQRNLIAKLALGL